MGKEQVSNASLGIEIHSAVVLQCCSIFFYFFMLLQEVKESLNHTSTTKIFQPKFLNLILNVMVC
ncbi:hypothetical protein EJ02DRAFT_457108 [Clathrospora elynae]|uniref:Uncharacterized protein n=1 Tax=Clathrospora elynae TaxID=706981 RepID=A0A6A5SHU2_9PLEO|nr:hypothetical protein EJ02DRAFT_457108 [Clathrospora elynae]